jgi:hypothetical protein
MSPLFFSGGRVTDVFLRLAANGLVSPHLFSPNSHALSIVNASRLAINAWPCPSSSSVGRSQRIDKVLLALNLDPKYEARLNIVSAFSILRRQGCDGTQRFYRPLSTGGFRQPSAWSFGSPTEDLPSIWSERPSAHWRSSGTKMSGRNSSEKPLRNAQH